MCFFKLKSRQNFNKVVENLQSIKRATCSSCPLHCWAAGPAEMDEIRANDLKQFLTQYCSCFFTPLKRISSEKYSYNNWALIKGERGEVRFDTEFDVTTERACSQTSCMLFLETKKSGVKIAGSKVLFLFLIYLKTFMKVKGVIMRKRRSCLVVNVILIKITKRSRTMPVYQIVHFPCL